MNIIRPLAFVPRSRTLDQWWDGLPFSLRSAVQAFAITAAVSSVALGAFALVTAPGS